MNRALTKASVNYRNDSWDLVDAVKVAKVELAELKESELPEEMKQLSSAERKTFLETKAKERAEIQSKITKLNAERSRYLAQQMKAQLGTNTLDSVMITTLHEQAQKRNFQFE